MEITAHFNGGPLDDREWKVNDWIVWVPVYQKSPTWEENNTQFIGYKQGRYEVKRDFAGEPVPHSLNSFYFEWKGFQ